MNFEKKNEGQKCNQFINLVMKVQFKFPIFSEKEIILIGMNQLLQLFP